MLVKMTADQPGSIDGFTIKLYLKGSEYDLPDDLGNVFVKQIKCAKAIKPKETTKAGKLETPEG